MKSTAAALLGGVALGIGLIGSPGAAIANDGVIQAAADPNAWAVNGRGYDNTRFSPLTQITTGNVGKLRLAYSFQLGSLRSNESTPLVIGDTLYVSTSWGPKYVYALDAATGAQKWKYEPEIPDDVLQFACCDVNNRGVTYADGKIFVGRLDGFLAALDAKTGKELWSTQVVDYKQGSVITSPPLVVKNLVITGFGGGEYGARGSLQAYDAATGKLLLRTYTVPLANEPGWIDSHLAVTNPFPIAERYKRLVAVGRRRRFTVLTEPALQLLRRHFSRMARPHILTDDGRLAYVVSVVLVVRHKLQSVVNQLANRYHYAVA